MTPRTGSWIAAGLAAALISWLWLCPPAANAQPARGKILRGLEFGGAGSDVEMRVRFGVPVRYVRHSPASVGDLVTVQLTLLTRAPADAVAGRGREALRPRARAAGPVEEVVFDGGGRLGAVLEIRFGRRVAFDVRQDDDLRSLRVTFSNPHPPPAPVEPVSGALPDAPARAESVAAERPPDLPPTTEGHLAVQIWAGPKGAAPPSVPAKLLPPGRRVYGVPFRREGAPWLRLRVGFFASPGEAERARHSLADVFSGAWVVEAGRSDRLAFEAEAPSREPKARVLPAPGRIAEAGVTVSSGSPDVAAWVEEARTALTRAELDRAIGLLSKALDAPEGPHSAAARELLGVARERKGQLAHARAEYETYLDRYPDGPGAERVRQRLGAMLTARSGPEEALRRSQRGGEAFDIDTFGSVYLSYRRGSRRADGFGRIFSESSVFSDLFAGVRAQTPRFQLYGELSGSYLHGFGADDESELRTSTLFVEARELEGPLSGGLGRLPGNTAGVIGRYDGIQASFRLNPTWTISAVAGFPADPFESNGIETDRRFGGVSLDATGLLPGLDGQVYTIHQQLSGETDRSAVGGEFRYVREGVFVAGLLDYDLHFGELGQAFLVAGWQSTASTHLNLLLDQRYLPVLTTRNALIGQPEGSLAELRRRLSGSEIDRLAEDRTARARTATLGLTHHLGERLQLALDVSAADFEGTPPSGGVAGFPGTGWQFSYSAQLIATDLVRNGDISTLGLRYLDSRSFDEAGLLLSWRGAVTGRVRLNPFVELTRARLRDREIVYGLEPGLRIDWWLGPFSVDLEASYEWLDGERFAGAENESGYSAVLGLRYDF